MHLVPQHIRDQLQGVKVLVVDDEYYSRKVIRTLLTSIGIVHMRDAENGEKALDIIRVFAPDVVLVDWEMPGMDGAAFARAVRTPGEFPHPNVPMIMLTGHSERWRVMEALRLGVNEYLLKPVSSKMLLDRLVATLTKPRPMIKVGSYYGPEPRPAASFQPLNEDVPDDVILIN
jgi:CheY-like chemotaxis protein